MRSVARMGVTSDRLAAHGIQLTKQCITAVFKAQTLLCRIFVAFRWFFSIKLMHPERILVPVLSLCSLDFCQNMYIGFLKNNYEAMLL